MKRVYDEFSTERNQLQSSLNNILTGISLRSVTVSGQAHSGLVCSILITIAGVRGQISRTMVMVGKRDTNGKKIWNAFVNGYQYELTSIAELKVAITQQVSLLKPLIQTR